MSLQRIFLTAFWVVCSIASGLQAQQATSTPELNTKHIPESAFAGVARCIPNNSKATNSLKCFRMRS